MTLSFLSLSYLLPDCSLLARLSLTPISITLYWLWQLSSPIQPAISAATPLQLSNNLPTHQDGTSRSDPGFCWQIHHYSLLRFVHNYPPFSHPNLDWLISHLGAFNFMWVNYQNSTTISRSHFRWATSQVLSKAKHYKSTRCITHSLSNSRPPPRFGLDLLYPRRTRLSALLSPMIPLTSYASPPLLSNTTRNQKR